MLFISLYFPSLYQFKNRLLRKRTFVDASFRIFASVSFLVTSADRPLKQKFIKFLIRPVRGGFPPAEI